MTEISLIFQAIRTTFVTRKSRQLRPDEDTIPEGTIHILRKHILWLFGPHPPPKVRKRIFSTENKQTIVIF